MKKFTFVNLLAGVMIIGVTGPELFSEAKPVATPAVEPVAATNEVPWLTDYDAALKQARSSNQLVVVDFYAPWCGFCKLMDQKTFADPNVQTRLKSFVPLKINQDDHPELVLKYGVPGLPTMLV